MSLVTHLRDNTILLFRLHQQFAFIESSGKRLFHIHMDAELHRLHTNREMAMIGSRHHHRVYLVRHLIEHIPEIAELRNAGKHTYHLLRMRCPHINITQSDDVTQTGIMKFFHHILSPVADANHGNIHSSVGFYNPCISFLSSRAGATASRSHYQ